MRNLNRLLCRLFGHRPGAWTRQLATPPAAWLFTPTAARTPADRRVLHPSWTGYLPDHDVAECRRCGVTVNKFDNAADEALAAAPFEERREHFRKLGWS